MKNDDYKELVKLGIQLNKQNAELKSLRNHLDFVKLLVAAGLVLILFQI